MEGGEGSEEHVTIYLLFFSCRYCNQKTWINLLKILRKKKKQKLRERRKKKEQDPQNKINRLCNVSFPYFGLTSFAISLRPPNIILQLQ